MQKRSVVLKIATVSAVLVGSLFVVFKSSSNATTVAARVDGAEVYGQKCAGCHGRDGKGSARLKDKGVPDFTDADWQKKHSDAQIKAGIENGKRPIMPGMERQASRRQYQRPGWRHSFTGL